MSSHCILDTEKSGVPRNQTNERNPSATIFPVPSGGGGGGGCSLLVIDIQIKERRGNRRDPLNQSPATQQRTQRRWKKNEAEEEVAIERSVHTHREEEDISVN